MAYVRSHKQAPATPLLAQSVLQPCTSQGIAQKPHMREAGIQNISNSGGATETHLASKASNSGAAWMMASQMLLRPASMREPNLDSCSGLRMPSSPPCPAGMGTGALLGTYAPTLLGQAGACIAQTLMNRSVQCAQISQFRQLTPLLHIWYHDIIIIIIIKLHVFQPHRADQMPGYHEMGQQLEHRPSQSTH